MAAILSSGPRMTSARSSLAEEVAAVPDEQNDGGDEVRERPQSRRALSSGARLRNVRRRVNTMGELHAQD